MDTLALLYAKHPQLFEAEPPQWSDLPSGWLPLVDALCADIGQCLPPSMLPHFHVSQIKEKFGGLRFYCDGAMTDEVEALIDDAEAKSLHICEVCGLPGHQRSGGYIRTLCDSCTLSISAPEGVALHDPAECSPEGLIGVDAFTSCLRALLDRGAVGFHIASHCYRVLTNESMRGDAIRTMVLARSARTLIQCRVCVTAPSPGLTMHRIDMLNAAQFLATLYLQDVTQAADMVQQIGHPLTEPASWALLHGAIKNQSAMPASPSPLPDIGE
jgi:hypothetical protein